MEFNDYAQLINQSVQQNNSWSAAQAQQQMDFQERMSNTAHQREVADLKAAGLNPILSAHTNGASTPSGAMATGDTSGTSALVDMLGTMIQTENANARAALKAQQNAGSYKSEPYQMMWEFIKDVTGNEGKTASEIAHSASDNLSKGLSSIVSGAMNGAKTAASALASSSFWQTMKNGFANRAAYATKDSLIGRATKTYSSGTKQRVSSSGSWKR